MWKEGQSLAPLVKLQIFAKLSAVVSQYDFMIRDCHEYRGIGTGNKRNNNKNKRKLELQACLSATRQKKK